MSARAAITQTASEIAGHHRCDLTASELSDLCNQNFEIVVHRRLRDGNAFQRMRDALAMVFDIQFGRERADRIRWSKRFDAHSNGSCWLSCEGCNHKMNRSLSAVVHERHGSISAAASIRSAIAA